MPEIPTLQTILKKISYRTNPKKGVTAVFHFKLDGRSLMAEGDGSTKQKAAEQLVDGLTSFVTDKGYAPPRDENYYHQTKQYRKAILDKTKQKRFLHFLRRLPPGERHRIRIPTPFEYQNAQQQREGAFLRQRQGDLLEPTNRKLVKVANPKGGSLSVPNELKETFEYLSARYPSAVKNANLAKVIGGSLASRSGLRRLGGSYADATRDLGVNTVYGYNPTELAGVAAHEIGHAHQHQRLGLPIYTATDETGMRYQRNPLELHANKIKATVMKGHRRAVSLVGKEADALQTEGQMLLSDRKRVFDMRLKLINKLGPDYAKKLGHSPAKLVRFAKSAGLGLVGIALAGMLLSTFAEDDRA